MSTTMVSIPESITDLAKELAELGVQRLKTIEEQKNTKDKDRKKEIGDRIKQLNSNIQNKYKAIMDQLNKNYLNNLQNISEIDLENFLKSGGICEALGVGIDFKSTQLRKLFHQIKSIKYLLKKGEGNLPLLKTKLLPTLAYSRGRKLIDEEFFQFIKMCIYKISDRKDFDIFADIFEAIVAYHRYHNPSN